MTFYDTTNPPDFADPIPDGLEEAVRGWVMSMYRQKFPDHHLSTCPQAQVSFEAYDGTYGCDTGCEYARLEATISCEHDTTFDYEYGEFGELAELLRDLIGWRDA